MNTNDQPDAVKAQATADAAALVLEGRLATLVDTLRDAINESQNGLWIDDSPGSWLALRAGVQAVLEKLRRVSP